MLNVVGGLVAYQLKDRKPQLSIKLINQANKSGHQTNKSGHPQ